MAFPRVLAQNEIASSRIWTQVAKSISCNCNIKGVSFDDDATTTTITTTTTSSSSNVFT